MSSEEVLPSLTSVVENCRAALRALVDETHVDDDHTTIDPATLRTDFLSILSLLYAASTKVALVLKPGTLGHHSAAIVPLNDLSINVAALTHSVRLMHRTQGQTLLAEYKDTAQNTIRSIEYFADGLHSSISQSREDGNYLVAVNKVHKLIDGAKRPGALSLDNMAAVRKKWLQDYDSLVDGAEEIREMANPTTDEEGFDDGWEDLGLKSKQDFSLEEKARLEMLQALIKLSNLLHKRILNDLLSQNLINSLLDQLSTHSSRLLVASDNLITALYSPQQPSIIALHLSGYLEVLRSLQHVLLPQQGQDLDERLAALSMSGQSADKTSRWFTICFDQIEKAAGKISGTLEENGILE